MNPDCSENIVDLSKNRIEQMKKQRDIKRKHLMNMILRQTNYTEEKVLEELKKWNYNTLYVMKAYLNPNFMVKKEKKLGSVNQRMMGEIRNFCDTGNKLNFMRRELTRQHQIIQNHITSQKERNPEENPS